MELEELEANMEVYMDNLEVNIDSLEVNMVIRAARCYA